MLGDPSDVPNLWPALSVGQKKFTLSFEIVGVLHISCQLYFLCTFAYNSLSIGNQESYGRFGTFAPLGQDEG